MHLRQMATLNFNLGERQGCLMSARSLRRNHARALADTRRKDARRGRRFGLAAGAAVGATALFAPSAGAATFEVNSAADGASNACDSDCTLRDAIAAANADADGNADTVTFASSVTGTVNLTEGQLDVTDPEGLTITGPGAGNLTIDANKNSRIFYVNTTAPVSITGLTLTNGAFATQKYDSSDAGTGENAPGGGAVLTAPDSNLAVGDSVIVGNAVTGSPATGGGILGQASKVDVAHTTITGNTAGTGGGGIAVTDTFKYSDTPPSVASTDDESCPITAFCGSGESIASGPSTLTVSNSEVTDNGAGFGGGINAYGTTTSVSGTNVTGNKATIGQGGGIASSVGTGTPLITAPNIDRGAADASSSEATGSLAIDTSHIDDNDSVGEAGGISVQSFTGFSLDDSTVSGNDAADGQGGGIELGHGVVNEPAGDAVAAGSAEITTSTIADNTSYEGGGGLYVDGVASGTSLRSAAAPSPATRPTSRPTPRMTSTTSEVESPSMASSPVTRR